MIIILRWSEYRDNKGNPLTSFVVARDDNLILLSYKMSGKMHQEWFHADYLASDLIGSAKKPKDYNKYYRHAIIGLFEEDEE
jgi:hypothetical protein